MKTIAESSDSQSRRLGPGRTVGLLVALACGACTATSLNVAPVIDLSRPSSARSSAPAPVAPAPVAAQPAAAPAAADADSAPAEAQVQAVPLATAPAVVARPLDNPAPLPAAPAPAAPPPSAGAAPAPAAASAPAAETPATNWVWPVDGPVLVKFDAAHGKGIDIGVAEGAPVRAVADGSVSYTGSPLDYGNLVVVSHGNGLRTVYGHNKSIQVTQGETVTRGQIIATAGKTGAAAPMLHFEVRLRGVPVDPLSYLPAR